MEPFTNPYLRIDPELRKQAEDILLSQGISPYNALTMFYPQIVVQRGFPFDAMPLTGLPVDAGRLTATELDAELQKGYDDMLAGRVRDVDSVFADIRRDFRI